MIAKVSARSIVVLASVSMVVMLQAIMQNGARASFSTSLFYAEYNEFDGTEPQGTPLSFESHHRGKISHIHSGAWDNCMIRAVLGFTDPPGHPIDPLHVVSQQYTYGTFPPWIDGEISMGTNGLQQLTGADSTDWKCTTADHYLGWAKTTYSFNGGQEVTGDWSELVFHST